MAHETKVHRGIAYQTGSIALALALATILTAWGFQYLGGYAPCPLCLEERYAYYFGVPALFAALALLSGGNRRAAMWIFALVALAFLVNAGVSVYHAGAELKFWPGPDTCTGGQSISNAAGGLLKELETIKVPRCDEPAVLVFGLSLAAWNVVASLLLFALALRAAFAGSEPA